MRPGIREDGAGRGLLRGAPTRPLARPHTQAPLKLPEAWRAELPQSPALLSAQPPRSPPPAENKKASVWRLLSYLPATPAAA